MPLEQRLWDEEGANETDFGENTLEHSGLVLLLLVLKYCVEDDIVSDLLLSNAQQSMDESLKHFEIPSVAAAAASLQLDTNGILASLGR